MRSLRPFGFALLWLVLFEALLRFTCAPDPRPVRDPEHPYGCLADDELAQLVAAREADGVADRPAGGLPLDVVLVGDSVLASVENLPGQRLADALRPALQRSWAAAGPVGPPIRVWTLAAGGARASDVYAMLRRVARTLRAGRRGTQGVLVVVSSNVIFFSQRHRQPELFYPCLAQELSGAAADAGPLMPELRARLAGLGLGAIDSAAGRLEHRLLAEATARLYLLQQRRRLAEALFGGPPRLALRERLQQLLHRTPRPAGPSGSRPADAQAAADRPWTQRGLSAAQFAESYDLVPLSSPAAANWLWTRVLASWLGSQPDLIAVALLVPQNHALLGALADGPAYTAVGTEIAAAFRRAGVPYVSYDHDPALAAEHFLDLDHLTSAGNRALAARLAAALTPKLRDLWAR